MTTQVHPSDSAETPDLRILALDVLVEHEYNDAQRTTPLAARIAHEGQLKNPPIVTPLLGDGERFVVLDGANRVTALRSLGCPHILVQVVRYQPPHVTLTTWNHVVTGLDPAGFTTDLGAVPGIDFYPVDLLAARAGLARRELVVYVIRADGKVFAVRSSVPRREIHATNRLLNALVDTYRSRAELHRMVNDSLAEAMRLYPALSGMVIFPKYEPEEVLLLAQEGELLPTGLTRHLIQGRALRLNYPLGELTSELSLQDKNQRLQRWVSDKLVTKEVRFYGETTYLFDE